MHDLHVHDISTIKDYAQHLKKFAIIVAYMTD
jgi:hypothetical protein